MKIKLHLLSIVLALMAGVQMVSAQGTAFTYQGQLTTGSGPANGYYDVTFKLWNNSSGGSQVGSTQTFPATVVSNGLFTVIIDFGAVYNGTPFWLELAVRSNGIPPYQTLIPRQPLTPTPYAITAENVDGLVPAGQLSGTIPSVNLSGTYLNGLTFNNVGNVFDGNGAGLTGVNASSLNGHDANFFWQLKGNTGTTPGVNYLGTTDLTPLEIDVQGMQALRIEPDITYGDHIPNIIGGSPGNFVKSGTVGNFIGGGGSYKENSTNYINAANYNVIGGGWENHITNFTYEGTIGGGEYNTVGNSEATVGGGNENAATGSSSTVPGGFGNLAAGDYSFAAGSSATANNSGSFVWSDNSGFPTTDSGANQFVVRATGGAFFYDGATGVVIDSSGSNYGTIDFGIKFGLGSGEGIASQRAAGPNQYDLNFYTAFADRMTIVNNGFVGINTTNPLAQLHIIRGTGTGASDPYDGGPALIADITSGDGLYVKDTDSDGFAVWANATSGIGVDSDVTSGTAVEASSSTGTGVYTYSGSGSALTIASGAIHVSGASTNNPNTAAFIQYATAANTSSYITTINNTLCNGDPNAILLVTHNFNPVGVPGNYDTHPFSVYYNGSRWTIYNDDFAAITGMSFNVLVIKN